MTAILSQVRPGAYYDSVVLMQLQRALLTLPGVEDAGAVMATPANFELLEANALRPSTSAGPDDLLIVVKAESTHAGEAALGQIDALLARRRSAVQAEFSPRSLASAARQIPDAGWVLISVPGRFAAGVARQALDEGKHIFLYSDNVSLDDEATLKAEARDRGLLVMGPDCGTAIVGGIGFGFANQARRGSIGLVAASGTGLQAVVSGIHARGAGISQALGTGGRDLHAEVGGISALQSLDVLRRDPETAVIVVISKPPEPEVAGRLLAAARRCGKPVVLDLIGLAGAGGRIGNLHFASSLEQTAEMAAALSREPGEAPPADPSEISGRYLRGLFSGGTLAYEAVLGFQLLLHPLFTNVPLHEGQRLEDALHSRAHTLLDLGADQFTVGRLHPMLDNDLRLRRLRQEAADPEAGVILLDVVLGHGAHPDPASELAPAIAEALRRGGLEVVVVIVGTDEDPQGLSDQIERLRSAGARVHLGLPAAMEDVLGLLPEPELKAWPPVPLEAFSSPPAAINVGLESFYESLTTQGAPAIHVDWRPPAGGNERMMGILAKMKARGQAG